MKIEEALKPLEVEWNPEESIMGVQFNKGRRVVPKSLDLEKSQIFKGSTFDRKERVLSIDEMTELPSSVIKGARKQQVQRLVRVEREHSLDNNLESRPQVRIGQKQRSKEEQTRMKELGLLEDFVETFPDEEGWEVDMMDELRKIVPDGSSVQSMDPSYALGKWTIHRK